MVVGVFKALARGASGALMMALFEAVPPRNKVVFDAVPSILHAGGTAGSIVHRVVVDDTERGKGRRRHGNKHRNKGDFHVGSRIQKIVYLVYELVGWCNLE